MLRLLRSQYLTLAFEGDIDAGFGTGYWGVQKRSFGNPVIRNSILPANSGGSESYGVNIFSSI